MRPTVGRIVQVLNENRSGPAAAIVTKVHSDTMINVRVLDDDPKVPEWRTSVILSERLENKNHWMWPPRE